MFQNSQEFQRDREKMALSTTSILHQLLLLLGVVEVVKGCYSGSPNHNLNIGDTTYVCVTIGATNSITGQMMNYSRFVFDPNMDEFTKFNLQNSWSSTYSSDDLFNKLTAPEAPTADTQLWMHVESEGQFSYQKIYRGSLETWPHSGAVISVNNGKVDGITWDYGCFDCDASLCRRNTYKYNGDAIPKKDSGKECYLDDADCNSNKCSLRMYVTWSGTDSNGNYLLSQQKRLSNFEATVV